MSETLTVITTSMPILAPLMMFVLMHALQHAFAPPAYSILPYRVQRTLFRRMIRKA